MFIFFLFCENASKEDVNSRCPSRIYISQNKSLGTPVKKSRSSITWPLYRLLSKDMSETARERERRKMMTYGLTTCITLYQLRVFAIANYSVIDTVRWCSWVVVFVYVIQGIKSRMYRWKIEILSVAARSWLSQCLFSQKRGITKGST